MSDTECVGGEPPDCPQGAQLTLRAVCQVLPLVMCLSTFPARHLEQRVCRPLWSRGGAEFLPWGRGQVDVVFRQPWVASIAQTRLQLLGGESLNPVWKHDKQVCSLKAPTAEPSGQPRHYQDGGGGLCSLLWVPCWRCPFTLLPLRAHRGLGAAGPSPEKPCSWEVSRPPQAAGCFPLHFREDQVSALNVPTSVGASGIPMCRAHTASCDQDVLQIRGQLVASDTWLYHLQHDVLALLTTEIHSHFPSCDDERSS